MTVNRIAFLHSTQALGLAAAEAAQLVHETGRKLGELSDQMAHDHLQKGQMVKIGTIGHVRTLEVENNRGREHVDGRHRRAAEQQLAETVEVLSSGMTPEQRAWNKQVEEKRQLKKGKR